MLSRHFSLEKEFNNHYTGYNDVVIGSTDLKQALINKYSVCLGTIEKMGSAKKVGAYEVKYHR